jgi:dihydroorotate dehydrogenase
MKILEHLLDDLNSSKIAPIFIEINLGCPDTNQGVLPGYNLTIIKKILMLLKFKNYQNLAIGFKCPPYLDKTMIEKISAQINQHQSIHFVTISNTIPNTICFNQGKPVLSTTFGGMSGLVNTYINLGAITLFRQYLRQKDFKLIGCGGISNLNDVLEYFSCGASLIQLASCFYDEETNSLDGNKINQLVRQFSTNLNRLK